MSVRIHIKILSIVSIVLASSFLAACSTTNISTNASSISITATPTVEALSPVASEFANATAIPNAANPLPLDQLGDESRRMMIGGAKLLPTDVTSDTALPPVALSSDSVRPTAQPTQVQPTAEPTEAPVAPVTTYQTYVVRPGDSLTIIAGRTGVTVAKIMQMNGIRNMNWIYVGQALRIQATVQVGRAPSTKIIPDSEAVYSPAYENFDVNAVAQKYGGYLTRYQENVEGRMLTGPQIIQLVSERFSIGPRVLLTILEMQGGWVTGNPQTTTALYYPMGLGMASWSGLYRQVWYAADKLNEGYYGRVYSAMDTLAFNDGTRLALSSRVNPGTAALQDYFAYVSTYKSWTEELGPNGFTATYNKLFGDPFAHAIEPLIPANLAQPTLHLPWEEGHTWWFTGGPHGGWADGSAFAAVDFAPSQGSGTCWPSAEWATAAAPGVIVQAETGRVMENLEGKNFQGDGWTLMYMHMGSAGRVRPGDVIKTGDPIGHPSCEGGVSTADHLHFARLYNGQWIAAGDRQDPMDLSGWKFEGGDSEYDGSATRGPLYMEAFNGHDRTLNAVVSDDGPVPNTADNGPESKSNDNAAGTGMTTGVLAGISASGPDSIMSAQQEGRASAGPASPAQTAQPAPVQPAGPVQNTGMQPEPTATPTPAG